MSIPNGVNELDNEIIKDALTNMFNPYEARLNALTAQATRVIEESKRRDRIDDSIIKYLREEISYEENRWRYCDCLRVVMEAISDFISYCFPCCK